MKKPRILKYIRKKNYYGTPLWYHALKWIKIYQEADLLHKKIRFGV